MAKRRLFLFLASAAGYIGIGMLLGYALSDQTTNTPLWIGVALTLLGAILLGMFISARDLPVKTVGTENNLPPQEKPLP